MRLIWIFINLITSTVICSIPILLIGWFDSNLKISSKIIKIWAKWMIWATGLNYSVLGLDNIKKDGQYVFMCNHESALDIIFAISAIPNNIIFLAKKELFFIPLFGWAMKASGMIKIDRQNSEKAKKTIDNAITILLESSYSTLIYPEGTRSSNGELLSFKKGGFILAIRSGLSIVPLSIYGTGNVLPKGAYKIKKRNIVLHFGEVISTDKVTFKDKNLLIKKCYNSIKETLQNLSDNYNERYCLK